MNFSEWLDALQTPLYKVNEDLKCPPGYKWDKKNKMCVPKTKKDDVSASHKKDSNPMNGPGYNVIGSHGMNGAPYAYGVQDTRSPEASPYSESRYDDYDEKEKEFKKKDDEMKYGKKGKPSSLRPGEVRKPNSRGGYDSNYDK